MDNIMTHGRPSSWTKAQREDAKAFLTHIPPFPLDVSLATYYIKATNIPYKKYLDHLTQGDKNFETIQKNVLKESGEYAKTRYQIIALSLKKLIEAHKDFGGLLLLMSLIDPRHIPRNLLESYKKDVIIDDFIYNLKKYSLIMDEPSPSLGQLLSLHPSTQDMSLPYLVKTLDLQHNEALLKSLAYTFKNTMADAIDQDDLDRMKNLVTHCEKLLKQAAILGISLPPILKGELGGLYVTLGDHLKAQTVLENAFKEMRSEHFTPETAPILIYLGLVYRTLAKHKKAKGLLEQALQIYQHQVPQNHFRMAQLFTNLGGLEGDIGNYKASKELLEKSLHLYQTLGSLHGLKKAHVQISLGNLYKEFGEHDKAKAMLKEALLIEEKHSHQNQVKCLGL